MTPSMHDANPPREPSFFARLRRDARGNTLAIVGAALVPLTAMIGSGVDLSRAYMAKTRLQSACDAASLAGRRVMTNDTMSDAVRNEAVKFFNFNFPQRLYETAAFTPQVTRPGSGVVKVSASTTIPTVIMKMFGFTTLPLSVECDASQNFVNTDIVLVLDVTGSMLEDVNGNSTSNTANQKITALRDAVMALYDELAPVQTQLQNAGMRLRYGVVPYSSTVNVGHLIRAINANHIANSWTYQSRMAIYDVSSYQTYSNKSSYQCNAYASPRRPANSYPATEKTVYRPGWGDYRDCVVVTHNYTTMPSGSFSHWLHQPVVFDTSKYKTGASTPVPTRAPGTTQTSTWAGCIEERDTTASITGTHGYNIPAGAWDLNIDHVPSSEETRWRPHWPEVSYYRNSDAGVDNLSTSSSDSWSRNALADKGYVACPTGSRRLQPWTRNDLLSYVNSLAPVGGTYHDIGMIWGARLISDAGVFADSPNVHNGMPVAKHIIFMTDGQLAPNAGVYGAYGIESLDERIIGSAGTGEQYARHERRFKMICNAAKAKNASIWVVAFATGASAALTECASNSNQVSTSTNRDQLIAKFTEIGKNIGALRLTQ